MINVEISMGTIDRAGHETLVGNLICASLKKAGIPAIGTFALRGVERGSLTYETDHEHSKHSFAWREDEDDRENKFIRSQLKNGAVVFKSGRHAEDDDDEL